MESNNRELLEGIVNLRLRLISEYSGLRDYKNNKNALMKEEDHALALHSTIVEIDALLKGLVEFE